MSGPEVSELESLSTASLSTASISLSNVLSLQRKTRESKAEEGEMEGEDEEGGGGRNKKKVVGEEDVEEKKQDVVRGACEITTETVEGREEVEKEKASAPESLEEIEKEQKKKKRKIDTQTITETQSLAVAQGEENFQSLMESVPVIQQEFDLLSKIGEGTFSSVYLASLKGQPEEKFALKHLVPTSASSRIENELKCLQSMGGRDNVIPLLTCVRNRDHVVLIMPYFPHNRFTDYLPLLTPTEVQLYMIALFTALSNVHSHHIIHRDVKPSNFLYSRDTGRFQLVDFGLAHLEPGYQPTSTHASAALSKSRISSLPSHRPSPTPPSSSSLTHLPHSPHPHLTLHTTQIHINGISLIPSKHSYQRQLHGQLHVTRTTDGRKGRGRGRGDVGVGVRKRGKGREGGNEEQERGGRLRKGGRGGRGGKSSPCPTHHEAAAVCDVCMSRSHQNTPRAGTPGFRAPEVLLKCPNQTTAVDIWSAGVIFLCLLSGKYPFFRAHDDLSALAQIISLMGSEGCVKAAREMGKEMVLGQIIEPLDLRVLCRRLRRASCQQQQQQQYSVENHSSHETATKRCRLTNGDITPTNHHLHHHHHYHRYDLRSPKSLSRSPKPYTPQSPQSNSNKSFTFLNNNSSTTATSTRTPEQSKSNVGVQTTQDSVAVLWEGITDSAYSLLYRCLALNPAQRITAKEALMHPFLTGHIAR